MDFSQEYSKKVLAKRRIMGEDARPCNSPAKESVRPPPGRTHLGERMSRTIAETGIRKSQILGMSIRTSATKIISQRLRGRSPHGG